MKNLSTHITESFQINESFKSSMIANLMLNNEEIFKKAKNLSINWVNLEDNDVEQSIDIKSAMQLSSSKTYIIWCREDGDILAITYADKIVATKQALSAPTRSSKMGSKLKHEDNYKRIIDLTGQTKQVYIIKNS